MAFFFLAMAVEWHAMKKQLCTILCAVAVAAPACAADVDSMKSVEMTSTAAATSTTSVVTPAKSTTPAASSTKSTTTPRVADLNLIKVPLTRQATDYTCGAAAVQSVIGYYGDNVREEALARELRTNSVRGTAYQQILAYAKRHGYKTAVYKNSSLESVQKLLDAGTPVICLIQAWPERKVDYTKDWEDGHYVVAVGHDASNVYFMDPCTLGQYTFIPKAEFLQRWHDTDGKERLTHFAMTMTKPTPKHDPDQIVKME
jgi:predicted double-glycine peptidase